jgi:hypothetical protein
VLLADVLDGGTFERPGWKVEPFEARLRGVEGERRLVRLGLLEKRENTARFSSTPAYSSAR